MRLSFQTTLSDGEHLSCGQFMHGLALTSAAMLGRHVTKIFPLRARKKMFRIAASAVIATVTDHKPGGDGAYAKFIRQPVSTQGNLTDGAHGQHPVAIMRRPLPLPATITSTIHIPPKPSLGVLHRASYRLWIAMPPIVKMVAFAETLAVMLEKTIRDSACSHFRMIPQCHN